MKSKISQLWQGRNKNKHGTETIGEASETRAANYLAKKGVTILERNYRCRFGELDIIGKDKNTLVFVEVRFRKNNTFGGAAASVTVTKQNKIRLSAKHYLMTHKLLEKHAVRFDVIAISNQDFDWIKGAF